MDDQAKPADDPVMDDPQVKADQAKLDADIAALREKQREADQARQKDEEAKAAQAARDVEAAKLMQAGALPNAVTAANALGAADAAAMQNVQVGVQNVLNPAPAVADKPDPVALTPEEKAEQQRQENLQRAIDNGYREPDQPSPKDQAEALIASMEHQVTHNGPITLEMLRDLRTILQLPKQPAPVAEG